MLLKVSVLTWNKVLLKNQKLNFKCFFHFNKIIISKTYMITLHKKRMKIRLLPTRSTVLCNLASQKLGFVTFSFGFGLGFFFLPQLYYSLAYQKYQFSFLRDILVLILFFSFFSFFSSFFLKFFSHILHLTQLQFSPLSLS